MNEEQILKLINYIIKALETGEMGTYRYLIYEIVGNISYGVGMRLGLLDLNNALFQAVKNKERPIKIL